MNRGDADQDAGAFTVRDGQVLLDGTSVGNQLPPSLTTINEKRTLYATDIYFEEAWEELAAAWPAEELRVKNIDDVSLVLLKPDALARDQVGTAWDWLEQNGFDVVWSKRVAVDRHIARALWWYQWNFASRRRRELSEFILNLGHCILLIVRKEQNSTGSTSRELSERKGSARPEHLEPADMRSALGAVDYLSNSVHTPDESADFVRELAILLTQTERDEVVRELLETSPGQVRSRPPLTQPSNARPSPEATNIRVTEIISKLGAEAFERKLEIGVDAHPSISELSVRLTSLARAAGVDWSNWDTALFLTARMPANREERRRLLS